MNAIRTAITIFLILVLIVVGFGWQHSGDMPPANILGARVALIIAGLSAVIGLGLIWSVKPRQPA